MKQHFCVGAFREPGLLTLPYLHICVVILATFTVIREFQTVGPVHRFPPIGMVAIFAPTDIRSQTDV